VCGTTLQHTEENGGEINEHWYAQVLKLVVTNNNKCKPTEPHKLDVIIHNNENGTCMSIDVKISRGRNMVTKQAWKILKYEDLTIEIQCMWKVNTKVIKVIIGSTETILKSFRKCLTNIMGKQEIKELNKTTILGTTHILWIVLIHKYQTFNMGNNITCNTNYKYRIAAKLYTRIT